MPDLPHYICTPATYICVKSTTSHPQSYDILDLHPRDQTAQMLKLSGVLASFVNIINIIIIGIAIVSIANVIIAEMIVLGGE